MSAVSGKKKYQALAATAAKFLGADVFGSNGVAVSHNSAKLIR